MSFIVFVGTFSWDTVVEHVLHRRDLYIIYVSFIPCGLYDIRNIWGEKSKNSPYGPLP